MSLLIDKTLKEYGDILASKEPAPGGGSTAALSGTLGASLFMMVVNLSIGKKSYEALDETCKSAVMAEYGIIEKVKAELEAIVDEDTQAFNKVMEAMKLPKETEDEKKVRSEKLQSANLYALQVPLKTVEKCYEALSNAKNIAMYGNKNAASDAGVGALLLLSGLEGAALNVKINLPGIQDEKLKSEVWDKCESLINRGKELQKELLEIVNNRIG